MTTKKFIIAYNPEKLHAESKDFLVPIKKQGSYCFIGVDTGKVYQYGCVVYVGKDITANDVFAKLIDSTDYKIMNVDETFASLEAYLTMIKSLKIGDVVTIQMDSDNSVGFKLNKN